MKIIEALKQIKELKRKADDLKNKVARHCALSSLETPEYGKDQKSKIDGWLQAHSDIIKEILRLRVAIQRTNLETQVTIEIDGKQVKKTIAAWIHRRRDLAGEELKIWGMLGDRNIREGVGKSPSGDALEIKIQRFYDPGERDKKKEAFSNEPSVIDAKLEIMNAVTDLNES